MNLMRRELKEGLRGGVRKVRRHRNLMRRELKDSENLRIALAWYSVESHEERIERAICLTGCSFPINKESHEERIESCLSPPGPKGGARI